MGQQGAKPAQAAAGSGGDSGAAPQCTKWRVRALENVTEEPCDMMLTMQFTPEAITFHNGAEELVRAFPYHAIMCWGHNEYIFQFRLRTEDESDDLLTVVVGTRQGADMEDEIMEKVLHLMKDMDAVGVSKGEFEGLLAQLEADPDSLLGDVRTVALTKAFDAKQASQLVEAVGGISPFDQVEAAVLMYDSLINKHSFNLVLDVFTAAEDRDNICHRLGIVRNADGSFKHLPARSRLLRKGQDSLGFVAAAGGDAKK